MKSTLESLSKTVTRKTILLWIPVFSVPAGVVIASLILPLKPFIEQVLMGITLIWIYTGAMAFLQTLS